MFRTKKQHSICKYGKKWDSGFDEITRFHSDPSLLKKLVNKQCCFSLGKWSVDLHPWVVNLAKVLTT